LPSECQLVTANMMFNFGKDGLARFRRMKAAVDNSEWNMAADEVVHSLWFNHVPNRAGRLVDRMRSLAAH
jgi:hypothetical protein